NLVGFVDDNPRDRVTGLEHVAMLGEPEQLGELVKLLDIDRVVIAFSNESPGPVIFRQVRMGTRGQPFPMWKFRTMATDAEEQKAELVHLSKHAEPGGDPRMFKI